VNPAIKMQNAKASTRRAIVTSMPPGRASFPKSYSVCSSGRHGRSYRPTLQLASASQGPKLDISARMRGMWRYNLPQPEPTHRVEQALNCLPSHRNNAEPE
jgi:hypothetical protein